MIKRSIVPHINELSDQFRSVTLNGPRQSGKTTLALLLFPDYRYVSLEDPDNRRAALEDPRSFLANYPAGTIIDEIQEAPELMSYLQSILDNDKSKCQYVLTGSQNFLISELVSQSLVGRTALATLLPLTLSEIRQINPGISVEQAILRGGYPAIHTEQIFPTNFFKSYRSLYMERDVRSIRQITNYIDFERFIELVAGRVGQIVNLESLSSDLGVDNRTVNDWLSILETSFLTFRLQPYFKRMSRRIVKRPKVYFYDTGLLCSLLGITTTEELLKSPYWGNIFENFVILEKMKQYHNLGRDVPMYFIRDSKGVEIDLLYRDGTEWHGVEIKASMTYSSEFKNSLLTLSQLFAELDFTKTVVYRGESYKNIDANFLNIEEFLNK
jgi:uncharacterized protein